jgi:hypothetical protein
VQIGALWHSAWDVEQVRVLNVGRRVATAEARITDAKGRLLAHATTTCLVFEFPKGIAEVNNWEGS